MNEFIEATSVVRYSIQGIFIFQVCSSIILSFPALKIYLTEEKLLEVGGSQWRHAWGDVP